MITTSQSSGFQRRQQDPPPGLRGLLKASRNKLGPITHRSVSIFVLLPIKSRTRGRLSLDGDAVAGWSGLEAGIETACNIAHIGSAARRHGKPRS